MTFKTFCPKRGLVRYQLKRFWWASAAYGLILFLIGPFMLLNQDRDYLAERAVTHPTTVGSFLMNHTASYILLIAAAVILGVCVCRFMQTVRSATLFHAMPVTRSELYISMLTSGFILLLLPLAANTLIFLLLCSGGSLRLVLPPQYILDWFGGQLLTGTSALCFCICLGVLCGSSVAQAVFVGALCVIPVGAFNIVSWMLNDWLFSFTSVSADRYSEFLFQILPLYWPQYWLKEGSQAWITVLQAVYIVLFGGLGLWAFCRRDVEHAGDVVAFLWIRPVFLYGTTFCVMLAGSFFVRSVSASARQGVNVLVMLLFALLGYAAAKMLLQKSFRIARYYKGYVVFAVLVLLAYFAVDANIFGYGKHVPDTNRIEAAYVSRSYQSDWARDPEESSGTSGAKFYDREGIEAVRALHQKAIDGGKTESNDLENQTVYIGYVQKGGRGTVRRYRVPQKEVYALLSTDAAKDSMYPVFRKRPETIRYIEFPHGGEAVYGKEKDELIACVQKDLQALSYEEIDGSRRYMMAEAAGEATPLTTPGTTAPEPIPNVDAADIHFYSLLVNVRTEDGTNQDIYFDMNTNFKNTLAWNESHGYHLGGK